jgi:hypothetical protein
MSLLELYSCMERCTNGRDSGGGCIWCLLIVWGGNVL